MSLQRKNDPANRAAMGARRRRPDDREDSKRVRRVVWGDVRRQTTGDGPGRAESAARLLFPRMRYPVDATLRGSHLRAGAPRQAEPVLSTGAVGEAHPARFFRANESDT